MTHFYYAFFHRFLVTIFEEVPFIFQKWDFESEFFNIWNVEFNMFSIHFSRFITYC